MRLSWTDPSPLPSGEYLALHTLNSFVLFDALHISQPTALHYFFTDHLGSTTLLTDETGNPLPDTVAHYLPFGSYRTTPPNPTLTDRGFTGHKHNDNLGLIYMNARYYLPGIGRFLSADTLIPDPANPQSFNRYAYVLNNPLYYTDPSGHSVDCGIGDPSCNVGDSPPPLPPPTPTIPPAPIPPPIPTPPPPVTPSVIEAQLLASTILLKFLYQGPAGCPIGSRATCIASSHGTVMDDHTLLSHNHFQEFEFLIQEIHLYNASGKSVASVQQLTQRFNSNEQSSTLEFAVGTFTDYPPATFGDVSSTGVGVGDRVAVIDWDGKNPGSTHVVWATVTDVAFHKGSPALQVDINISSGASGGGVFFNGIHVANNWKTAEKMYYSIAAINQ